MPMLIAGVDLETTILPLVAAAGGGRINVPSGIHTGSFVLGASNVWFCGEDMYSSIMRFVPTIGEQFLVSYDATFRRRVRFTDICFDGNNDATLVALIRAGGYGFDEWVFERCWFKNFPGLGFAGAQLRNTKFVDCLFTAKGDITGTAIHLSDSVVDIDILGCKFLWTNSAVIIDTGGAGELASERVRFVGNTVRQDYWGAQPYADISATGSGGTVSYTANTLTNTDPSKDFTDIPDDFLRMVRAMPVLRTGTTTNVGTNVLEDNAAAFLTYAVRYGDIVRTASAWTMVRGTVAGVTTKLLIDGWRDNTTYEPVVGPAIGTAYTVYRIYVARVGSRTSTVVTTDRWRDLRGNTITNIPAGTQYEILGMRAAAGIHFEDGVQRALIANNFFHGGWADQITTRGRDCLITDNVSVYGQDMGMSIGGKGTTVHGGVYAHNGVNGIWAYSDHIVIENVTAHDNACQYNPTFTPYLGDIVFADNDYGAVRNCTIYRGDSPNNNYGIVIAASGGSTGAGVRVQDNIIQDHTIAPMAFVDAHATVRVRSS